MWANHKSIEHLFDLIQYSKFLMFTIVQDLLKAILQG